MKTSQQKRVFDFNDKYLSGGKQEADTPAREPGIKQLRKLRLGEKTYKTLGCKIVARVDFLKQRYAKSIRERVNTPPAVYTFITGRKKEFLA